MEIEPNVKTLFSIGRGLPSEVGLPQAMALLGLKLEGTHHRGHDDAWNIAAVLWELIKNFAGKVSDQNGNTTTACDWCVAIADGRPMPDGDRAKG